MERGNLMEQVGIERDFFKNEENLNPSRKLGTFKARKTATGP